MANRLRAPYLMNIQQSDQEGMEKEPINAQIRVVANLCEYKYEYIF